WSFLGYSGVGHSNTKVVLLDKYTADVIRERRALAPIPRWLQDKCADRFDSTLSPFWSDQTSLESERKYLLPYAVDVGVLVFQQDVLSTITSEKAPAVPTTCEDLLNLGRPLVQYSSPADKPINYLFFI